MATGTTTKWLGICLHYGEPWERFLVKAVKPFTDVALQTGVAQQFYFERNWERGPNIRLWFKGSPYILTRILKPNLEEHFNQYFESFPSTIKAPSYPPDFPESQKWRPANSIHFLWYDPAMDRRYGLREQPLFEDQFGASSALVLREMKSRNFGWTLQEMMSLAMKCHLSMVLATGMSIHDAGRFFRYMFANWDNRAGNQGEETTFRSFFQRQRKDMVSYHAAIWEIFRTLNPAGDDRWGDWVKVHARLGIDLLWALEKGKIHPPSIQNGEDPTWPFYEELICLMNNRMGILERNEGYLFYMMAESIQVLLLRQPRYSVADRYRQPAVHRLPSLNSDL